MSIFTLLRPLQRAATASVRASACRGYVVELDPEQEGPPRMLQHLWGGGVVHFRSLDQARAAMKRRGVRRARLIQRLACEEVSALGVSPLEEVGVELLDVAGA